MNEQLDSQLSAMFDDELPPAECELLARRLSRDEQLKTRWGRYAMIGAAIRAERGVRLNGSLSAKVSAALANEPALASQPVAKAPNRWAPTWWQPLAGVAMAAGVAAVSILWLRTQGTAEIPTVAARTAGVSAAAPAPAPRLAASAATPAGGEPDSYVVPKNQARRLVVPSTELANYVVAHSEFSSPVARRNLLSAFMASETGAANASDVTEEEVVDDAQDDAKNPQ